MGLAHHLRPAAAGLLLAPLLAPFLAQAADAAWADADGDGVPDEVEALLGTDPAAADGNGAADLAAYARALAPERAEGCAAEGAGTDAAAGGAAGADDAAAVVIQAEAMELVEGFAADTNPHAEEDGLIRAEGEALARARAVPDVPAGRYDLTLRYFDEDDGVSVLGVRLDDRLAALWLWDEERGSALADRASRTERRIPCLELAPGAVLEIFGMAGGDEPLRVDVVELRPSPAAE